MSRRHARQLRRAATAAGLSLLLAGTLAAMDAWIGTSTRVWPLVLGTGGLAVVAFAIRAPRPLRSGGLKAHFVLLGGAISFGSLVEALHAFGILGDSAYHAGLAAALGIAAAFLLTLASRPFPVEARVVRGLRLAASMLVLSASGLFFALGLGGHPDGAAAVAPMMLLAAAGVALARAGILTPPLGWHRL